MTNSSTTVLPSVTYVLEILTSSWSACEMDKVTFPGERIPGSLSLPFQDSNDRPWCR